MNEFGAIDVVILTAAAFVAVFVAAWIASPKLRKRIERPKYRFLRDVRSYKR